MVQFLYKIPIRIYLLLILLVFLTLLCSSSDTYQVAIEGIEDKKLAAKFLDATTTYTKRGTATISFSELKARSESDIEKLIDLAHYHGYYLATASYTCTSLPKMAVEFHVTLGPQFTLKSLQLVAVDEESREILSKISPIKQPLGQIITTQKILDYENLVLFTLKMNGCATAEIVKKEVVADAKEHTLDVTLHVQTGPQVHFGPLQITGNKSVNAETIHKYIFWKPGDLYDAKKVEKTESALEKTGLFTSVNLIQEPISGDSLPMTLNLQEAKHKSLGFGLSYTTTWGPGITAEWENRNLRGSGDILAFRAELWERYQTATLSLIKPRDQNMDMDIIWLLEYNKLHTLAFDSRSYSLSRLIQKRISQNSEFGFGGRLEWLDSKNYDSDQIYYLIKLPIQLKVSSADNFLDPKSGQTLNIKVTPTTQAQSPHFFYGSQTTSLSTYHTLPNDSLTLAGKVVFGNIMGAARNTIPPPDRFYGGSENVLRGYRAFTVSPLHKDRIPLGGRSLLAASAEMRFRTRGNFGWAFFYDVGNVYGTNLPKLQIRQLQSVGMGIRYATPIGPLRFDIAVPLNPRAHIDPRMQIFFSIGQSF